MSIKGINDGIKNWSIRWDRVFTTVSGEGQPQSYFKYFLFALAVFLLENFLEKEKLKTVNLIVKKIKSHTRFKSNFMTFLYVKINV
jgi:hypothetical protein